MESASAHRSASAQPFTLLTYPLTNGFIHDWLVAGPLAVLLPGSEETPAQPADGGPALDDPGLLSAPPVELDPFGALHWRYFRCRPDHYVDLSAFYPQPCSLRAWVYAQVQVDAGQEVDLVLTTAGAAALWLNGSRVSFGENRPLGFSETLKVSSASCGASNQSAKVFLRAGGNDLLVCFEQAGRGETAHALALQLKGLDGPALVQVPTRMESGILARRVAMEKIVEAMYLDRYVYGYLDGDRFEKNEPLALRFAGADDCQAVAPIEITQRLQDFSGSIFQEATRPCRPGDSFEMAKTFPLRNGPHYLALVPPANDYFVKKMRFERRDLFYVVRTPTAQKPYLRGDPALTLARRREEALTDATQRRNESIYSEVARAALGRWEKLDRKVLAQTLARIGQQHEGSVNDLLGLLGMRLRFGRKHAFPADLKQSIKDCAQGYCYWSEQPGAKGMDYTAESRQILFHTCEILAGQLYPSRTFASGKTGLWHTQHGEALALAWLQQRGAWGWQEWDSPSGFEAALAALAHLVDFSKNEALVDLAAVLMDKILFSLALGSYQGAFGAGRGSSDTASVLSARLQPTSGVSRLLWGLGTFNENLMGVVSLATCEKYELPETIRQIANESPAALWGRAQDAGGAGRTGVNRVVYKTADFMLASAQDYRPGEAGAQEHVWQATLGPDSLVYVNHPANFSVEDVHRPNLWVGNRSLPRVAQWGDVLLALYALPEDDWLGFTHAYFPAATFDEYVLQGDWAFARKGKGYLALTAAQGLEWIVQGQTALRELRSYGRKNIWLCQMGQELLDGSFAAFQQKALAARLEFDLAAEPFAVRYQSLRGDALNFAWRGDLIVNEQVQPLTGFKHFENPYCVVDLPAAQMDILYQEEGIRLKF